MRKLEIRIVEAEEKFGKRKRVKSQTRKIVLENCIRQI